MTLVVDQVTGTILCVFAEAAPTGIAAGDAGGVPTPVTAAAHQLFSIARERGSGDHDVSAVPRAITAR